MLKHDNEKIIIKDVFDKIEMPEIDVKHMVLNNLNGKAKKSVNKFRISLAIILVLLIVCLSVYKAPIVVAYAKEIASSFINTFITNKDTVEMSGEYIKLNNNACKEYSKYSSVSEIEKMLKIKILKHPNAYEVDKNTITYTPYVTKTNELYGAMLINQFYLTGDLSNIEIKTFDDNVGNQIFYDEGVLYKTPILCQITIRSDIEPSKYYENHELEYGGANWNLTESKNVEMYVCNKLGIQVVLHTIETDGPVAWSTFTPSKIKNISVAQFIYKNIEYLYLGEVSYDTMKEIIDGLEL